MKLLWLTLAFVPLLRAADSGPQLGLQSWTCRNLSFEQTLDFAVAHGIKYVELTPKHLDPATPRDELLKKKAQIEQRGLVAYSSGVNQTSMDEAVDRQLFEFAKIMGMKFLVVEPKNAGEWDILEKLVKEYDIKLAIHNHGRDTAFGDPARVQAVLAKRDPRIGVCLDIGWVTAAGFDAATVFRAYGNRVYDLHFKDKHIEEVDGKRVPVDTEIGQGTANYRELFAALAQAHWSGVMAIETDGPIFATNPAQFVDHAKAFFTSQVAASRK